MGTTTNNGWPTPVATDLVKDGWEAIKDLGDAIDTTLGVYSSSTPGLTLINTTSFSAVTSQSINDVFSATYKNYRLVFNFELAATADLFLRLRVAGADNTSANYAWARMQAISDSASPAYNGGGSNGLTAAGFRLNTSVNAGENSVSTDIFNPFLTARTNFTTTSAFSFNSTNTGMFFGAGGTSVTTSYTGFTIYQSTGSNNLTGSVSVYGYNK